MAKRNQSTHLPFKGLNMLRLPVHMFCYCKQTAWLVTQSDCKLLVPTQTSQFYSTQFTLSQLTASRLKVEAHDEVYCGWYSCHRQRRPWYGEIVMQRVIALIALTAEMYKYNPLNAANRLLWTVHSRSALSLLSSAASCNVQARNHPTMLGGNCISGRVDLTEPFGGQFSCSYLSQPPVSPLPSVVLSSPFPLRQEVAPSPARRSGERCELIQWGSGRSCGRKSIIVYFEVRKYP